MLLRFSLYGFLKNQRYFEPFLILAYLTRWSSSSRRCRTLNIVNFLGYPSSLEGTSDGESAPPFWSHLKGAFRDTLGHGGLRRLVAESMGFEGVFHAAKDYLQPVLLAVAATSALGASFGGDLSDVQRSAILVGIVYFGLHLLSSIASRRAHRLCEVAGGEDRAARWLWAASVAVFGVVLVSGWYDVLGALIMAFVLMHVLQNLWRPALISRIDAFGEESQGATVLSIESQGRRVATMALAPVLGVAMDAAQSQGIGAGPFWPIGVVGVVVGLLFLRLGGLETGPGVAGIRLAVDPPSGWDGWAHHGDRIREIRA